MVQSTVGIHKVCMSSQQSPVTNVSILRVQASAIQFTEYIDWYSLWHSTHLAKIPFQGLDFENLGRDPCLLLGFFPAKRTYCFCNVFRQCSARELQRFCKSATRFSPWGTRNAPEPYTRCRSSADSAPLVDLKLTSSSPRMTLVVPPPRFPQLNCSVDTHAATCVSVYNIILSQLNFRPLAQLKFI